MTDIQAALNAWAGIIALALAALSAALLCVILRRQKRGTEQREALDRLLQSTNDDTALLLRETQAHAQTTLSRGDYMQQSDLQSARLTQAMEARARDEAMRLDALARRLDAFGEAQDQRLHRVTATLDDKLSQNEQRIERMRDTLSQSVNRLQEENAKKLEEMRQTVDEKLHATLDQRLGESFSLVNQRLEQVYKGLGEMQLGALLQQVLSPSQYDENVAVVPGAPQRVEFAVKLPGQGEGTIYLPIDSKFPIEDYERLLAAQDAGDADAVKAAEGALNAALRTEAKRIHDKYIVPPHTTDFAVMFLPVEGLYAEALRARGLCEEMQEKFRVIVAGPTTLNALLTSLQVGFRTLAIEKRSSEVWNLLRAVKTEFGNFTRILEATQKQMNTVSKSIETASRKTRTIERRLRQVETLEDGEQAAQLLGTAEDEPAQAGDEE